jgi:cytoskeletal protein CcmA (bactofilin family)
MKRLFEAQSTKAPATPPKPQSTDRMLVVGPGIVVSGEIQSCDCLVVEGKVEANVACKELRIAHGGLFAGTAAVQNAEIIGRFEGDLKVSDRLVIRASGNVSAKVRYQQIEIERGGQLAGAIESGSTSEPARPTTRDQRRSA